MKRYLEFIKESVVNKMIRINSEKDFHLIKEGVEIIKVYNTNLTYLPKLPESLTHLFCSVNNLTFLPELPESLTNLSCYNNKLKSLPKLPESLTNLYCKNNQLSSLPELPESLKELFCGGNELEYLPELPNSLIELYCYSNNLKSLPKLPVSLRYMACDNNPLEYPIPNKFYKDQDNIWLNEFNLKLSSYEHQKRLIDKHGVYIMKKFENHPELISDKIKEENPTYFLSVEYGF